MSTDLIRIEGIIAEEVGEPRNDGSSGSGLYKVPLRLSGRPSVSWARLFVQNWDHPPQFTTMHRPGIAAVVGDKLILNGTTVEEVEKYHAETLRHIVEKVNNDAACIEEQDRRNREADQSFREDHTEHVRKIAERVRFDTE